MAHPRTHFRDYRALVERFLAGGAGVVEDLDLDALSTLRGAERSEAEDVLIEHLEGGGNDPRVPRALGALGSRRALPTLQRDAAHSDDETAVASALVLWEMARDRAAIDGLVRILTRGYLEAPRRMAAGALGYLGPLPGDAETAEAIDQALIAGMDDPAEAVRGAATGALMRRRGLAELADEPRSRLGHLTARVLNPLKAVRGPAIDEIREVLGALRAGRGQADLGLLPDPTPESPELERFRLSVFADPRSAGPWKNDVDLDTFRKLRGEDRRWGEQFLYYLLGEGDVRGLRAVVQLGDRGAVPALRELSARKGKIAAAARQALADLADA